MKADFVIFDGEGHGFRRLGDNGGEFVLAFDNGAAGEFNTLMVSDWLAHTPPDILAWLYRESIAALRTQSLKDRLAAEGLEVIASTPAELLATVKSEMARMGKLIREANIKM